MITRPKPEEGEEDLLRQQEEFLRNRNFVPSVTVINKRKPITSPGAGSSDGPSKRSKSKFAVSRRQHITEKNISTEVPGNVLGEIIERNADGLVFVEPPIKTCEAGFPQVFQIDKSVSYKEDKSVFAQMMAKKLGTGTEQMKVPVASPNIDLGKSSAILTGSDADIIHQENVRKLNKMTEEEIKIEQDNLFKVLDPKILKFLREMRHKKENNFSTSNVQISHGQESSDALQTHSDFSSSIPGDSKLIKKTEDFLPPLSVDADKWLNMNVVEEEKLLWLTDIPDPTPVPPNMEYSARFDFQGLLLPYSEEKVNVTTALYHHGEEPSRPGYTLEELYQLSRSSVLQQRVIAVNTIANILDKCKSGYYDECFQAPLFKQLVESEVFLLLRFCLDDNTELLLMTVLQALRNLLWNHADEICLDRLLGLPKGFVQPSLVVTIDINSTTKEEQETHEKEMKDHQIVQLDVIKGALRTDLILRLRYILETLRPGPKAIVCVLEILTRIVRHSRDSAFAITNCPRLLQIIIDSFVPVNWSPIVGSVKPIEMTSVYGVPLVEALKLLRIIASCSRSMASDLVHKHEVMKSVLSYLNVDPRECGLPQQEALRLSLESFYLWQTFMAYNLAIQEFWNMFPVIMRLIQFHVDATSSADSSSTFGHEHGAAILSLIEQAVQALNAQEKKFLSQQENREKIQRSLAYDDIKGFILPIRLLCVKWLAQLTTAKEITFSAQKLVASALNCLATLCVLQKQQSSVNIISLLEDVENFCNDNLLPFLLSHNFRKLSAQIRFSSCLLCNSISGEDRQTKSLPSVGALMWAGREVTPILKPDSSYPILQGLTSFLLIFYNLFKGLHHQFADCVFNEFMETYIDDLVSKKLHLKQHWFTHFEVKFLLKLIKLATYIDKNDDHFAKLHCLSLKLISFIQNNDRLLLKETFRGIVFNPQFFKGTTDLPFYLSTVNIDRQGISYIAILKETIENLNKILSHYEHWLNLSVIEEISAVDVIQLTYEFKDHEASLPSDWMYIPILKLYNQDLSTVSGNTDIIQLITSCLQWILLLECLRPSVLTGLNVTARFCRLSTVFLAGSDLFLDKKIHKCLELLLHTILQENDKLDFKCKIPGLVSFYDLYTQLLEQFAGVSYGDVLFGQYMLVPLQQRHSVSYRKLVWSEQAAVIRVLRVPKEELMFPITNLLEPCETEPSLLNCYLHCLATGIVREQWSPILYHVAFHHVAIFIVQNKELPLANQLKDKIEKLGNKDLQQKLLRYIGLHSVENNEDRYNF